MALVELVEHAPAKINLALHVTGQRADGYHLLESIVTFAQTAGNGCDVLRFHRSEADEFTVSGCFAHLLPTHSVPAQSGLSVAEGAPVNLVVKARDLLRRKMADNGIEAFPVAIQLEKKLPVAAGIGGGSADAAATLRGLQRLWEAELPAAELAALALSLGADVPMCLNGQASMVKGIGDELTPLATLPSLPLVIANPLVGVSTADIFRRLASKNNASIGALDGDWIDRLKALRNDLEPPARRLVVEIGELSTMLDAQDAVLSRMSGSGASCFGIFPSSQAAKIAAENLRYRKPDWYFQAIDTIGIKTIGNAP